MICRFDDGLVPGYVGDAVVPVTFHQGHDSLVVVGVVPDTDDDNRLRLLLTDAVILNILEKDLR